MIVAFYMLLLGFLAGFAVACLIDMARTPFTRHADEALDVARPQGPEDERDWGRR